MAYYGLGQCLGCGDDDDGRDGWVTLTSVVIAAGYRAPRWTAVVDSKTTGISICPGCLESPQGGLVRDLITGPQAAARAVEGCEIHCVRGGPARVRIFTSELARCPVCYGNARAVRGDRAPQAPLARRAVRALVYGAGQVALAFAGDLGDIYREMTTFPERSNHDDGHPSGPLPILLPTGREPRPERLGQRSGPALETDPEPGSDRPALSRPAMADGNRPTRRARLPRALRIARRGPRPAGRTHALPERSPAGPPADSGDGAPAPATGRQNARLTRKPEGKN